MLSSRRLGHGVSLPVVFFIGLAEAKPFIFLDVEKLPTSSIGATSVGDSS
jgi:hypothetical protein